MISRRRQLSPQLLLYFLAISFLGVAGGCFHTSYNNYLDDVFQIGAQARGALEFPRELPGFLVAAFTGLLALLPETRVAGLCGLMTCAGMLGLGMVQSPAGSGWEWMVFFTVLWAIGTHVIMPVQSSIGMSLAHPTRRGRRLGQMSGISAAATILGSVFVLLITRSHAATPYGPIFMVGGAMALCGGLTYSLIRGIGRQTARPRLVYDRKYWLYYVLCLLFGARKQLFITFGPWVLIKIFHQEVQTFAWLFIINSVLTVFTNPALGNLIDRWGERKILVLDALVMILVCLGYGGAHLLGPPGLYLAFACFVLDQVMFGVGNARTTYMAKIAQKPEHVTASLSLGITMDHAVSMSLPALGGWLWMQYGHGSVFVAGAATAVLSAIFSGMIRVPGGPAAAETTADESSLEEMTPPRTDPAASGDDETAPADEAQTP